MDHQSNTASYFSHLRRKSASFSKPQMLSFIVVFALIGLLIYRSFAAGVLVTSLEAEQMSLPAGGTVNLTGAGFSAGSTTLPAQDSLLLSQ